jgi:hypothetical protein
MLKRLAIPALIVVAVVTIVLVTRYEQKYYTPDSRYDLKCVQESSPTSTAASLTCKVDSKSEEEQGKASVQWWHVLLTWPEGITAWAVIFTLIAIATQAYLMRVHANHFAILAEATFKQTAILAESVAAAQKNADAALHQTNHMVASERAWLLVSRIEFTAGASDRPEGTKQVFIQCAAINHGRTPARVLGMKALTAIGPISDPGQTWDESLYDPDGETTPRWVILPDKASALACPVLGFTAEPGQVFRAPLGEGQARFIHGVVRYWDMFSETERFTRFCFRWDNENERPGLGTGFHVAGGDRFNQQT